MRKLNFDPTKTVLTITVGFLIVYLITSWNWAIITSVIVGIIGLFSKKLSEVINTLWMKLTMVLSYIIPNVIMAIIYYVILVPIALLSRITSRNDNMHLKDRGESTYVDINRKIDADSLEKMW
tara:strand:- start:12509 stop:12877 length:369 start_codon:yes stop_codon:yes gene_type:complete